MASILDATPQTSTPKSKLPYFFGIALVVAIIILIVFFSRFGQVSPQASNIRPCVRNCLLPVEVADHGAVKTLVYFFQKDQGKTTLTDIALAPLGTTLHGEAITADYRAMFERDYARFGDQAKEVPLPPSKQTSRVGATLLRPLFNLPA